MAEEPDVDAFWGAEEGAAVVEDAYGAVAEDDADDADLFFEDVGGAEEEVDHEGVFAGVQQGGPVAAAAADDAEVEEVEVENVAAAAPAPVRSRGAVAAVAPASVSAAAAAEAEAQAKADRDIALHLERHVPEPPKGKKGKGGKGKDKGKGDSKDKGKGDSKGKVGDSKGKGKNDKGKSDKGKNDKGKNDKGKNDKGKGKNKSKDLGAEVAAEDEDSPQFHGFVHQTTPGSTSLDVKCRKVVEEFDFEAVIPAWNNPAGCKVGDRISFNVDELIQEGEAEPRPMASNVIIKESTAKVGSLADVKTQVEYYMSDENLRKDKFFQESIRSSKGGWIPLTIILGCKKIQLLQATAATVLDAMSTSPEVEVRRKPAGQEAIRRKRPPPPLETGNPPQKKPRLNGAPAEDVEVGDQDVNDAEVDEAAVEAVEAATEAGSGNGASQAVAVTSDDVFLPGVVARTAGGKFFITCEAVKAEYGHDAFFVESQKPANVEVGSLVVFTLSPGSVTGRSPQAVLVGQLVPPGAAVMAAVAQ